MRLYSTIFLIVCAIMPASGCQSVRGYPDRVNDSDELITAVKATYPIADVIAHYANKTTDEEKRSYRNEIVTAYILAIDTNYSEFSKGMFAQRGYLTVGGETLKSLFGAAGALTSAGQTSQILSGLSAAYDAADGSVESNIYYSQTQLTVISTMTAERSKVRVRILKGCQASSTDYPLAAALTDLEDYYRAGSVPGALSAIATTAGQKQVEAETAFETLISPRPDFVDLIVLMEVARNQSKSLTDDQLKALLTSVPTPLSDAAEERLTQFDLDLGDVDGMSKNRKAFVTEQILIALAESDQDEAALRAWAAEIADKASANNQ